MSEEQIKPLPIVKAFVDYFTRRAKRVLKIKDSEFTHVSIDVHPDRQTVWVWFHGPAEIIGRVMLTSDGRKKGIIDNRTEDDRRK